MKAYQEAGLACDWEENKDCPSYKEIFHHHHFPFFTVD
jgi:hypothetical protein